MRSSVSTIGVSDGQGRQAGPGAELQPPCNNQQPNLPYDYFIISTPKIFLPHLFTFHFHVSPSYSHPKLPESEIHKTSIFDMESLFAVIAPEPKIGPSTSWVLNICVK